MNPLPLHAKIAIVGGGPAGALCALELAHTGHAVVVLEARTGPTQDARSLALSWASVEAFKAVGIALQDSALSPIEKVDVSQAGTFGQTHLDAADLDLPALGYVVDYRHLQAACDAALSAHPTIQWIQGAKVTTLKTLAHYALFTVERAGTTEECTAELVVLAEGGALLAGLKEVYQTIDPYGQWAVLAEIQADRPPAGVAYERFTPEGPMALLPRETGFALVWTLTPELAETRLQVEEATFLSELQRAFGDRAGQFCAVGQRAYFPLALKQVSSLAAQRVAMIGNAAQTLHPVAGQGLNLGVRDALTLAQTLAHQQDVGSFGLLKRYETARQKDRRAVIRFTDGLIHWFAPHDPVINRLRGFGLAALDSIPFLRNQFATYMVFGLT